MVFKVSRKPCRTALTTIFLIYDGLIRKSELAAKRYENNAHFIFYKIGSGKARVIGDKNLSISITLGKAS